ncbi:MAG TPA: uridylate kinase [Methylocella sp.]|nr:uridylate kinase [Methylocella sp.]
MKTNSRGLIVVKLGGSLALSLGFAPWLDVLSECRKPLILVPGGGPFADCARMAQAAMKFSDATAHHLALLSMEQFGVVLAAHSKKFVLADSRVEFEGASGAGKIPIWRPARMVLAASEVPQTWDVTSDSLAAWLARVMGACHLLLIKSCNVAAPAPISDLVAKKIIDPLFPRFVAASSAEVWLAGPHSLTAAADEFRRGALPGIKIACE